MSLSTWHPIWRAGGCPLSSDLCHAWALDVDINQNGADVVDLVNNIWDGPVVYMGHSNGAISSLVSASLDDKAVAVLGLDPVERIGGNHTDIARSLRVPATGIFGEAAACNTWNSGMEAYMAVPDRDLFRATEADHCDFEAPTGTVCTLACSGSNDLFTDDVIRSNILGLSTAFVSWHAVGDEEAMEWADSAVACSTRVHGCRDVCRTPPEMRRVSSSRFNPAQPCCAGFFYASFLDSDAITPSTTATWLASTWSPAVESR